MTKDNLRRLIKHWMLATDILKRIEARNTCGGSGSEFEPALDSKLEAILRYMDPELTPVEDSEFEHVTTDLGRAVLEALGELEAAKRGKHQHAIVYWAGCLVRRTGIMVAEHLIGESSQLTAESAT